MLSTFITWGDGEGKKISTVNEEEIGIHMLHVLTSE